MVRIFSNKNKATFINLLSKINWENELSDKNANEGMNVFNKKLTIAYNKSFPFVKLSRKRSKDVYLGLLQDLSRALSRNTYCIRNTFTIQLK